MLELLGKTRDAVEHRESEVGVVEELHRLSAGLLGRDLSDIDDLDVSASSSVVRSHISIYI